MTYLRKRIAVALCGILWILAGCSRAPSELEVAYRRGLAENPMREKLGLRGIETNWICFRSIGGRDEWITDLKKDTAAVKSVEHDPNGLLLSETDSYLSGRLVKLDDSAIQEEFKLTGDYPAGRLELLYIGADKEITSWTEGARGNNKSCLEVISRVRVKWNIRR